MKHSNRYLSILVVLLAPVILLLPASGFVLAQGGTWETKTSMPTARSAIAVAIDGKIYVIGGISQFGTPLPTVEIYDPVTDTWDTAKTPMPTARFTHFGCVANGKIYVFGGQTAAFDSSLATVEMYDPATDTWVTKQDLPEVRSQASANVVGGKIYIIAGQGGPDNLPRLSIAEYDPATDTWDTNKAGLPTPRVAPGTCVVNGKIYVIGGGVSGAGGPALGAVEIYDPAIDSWSAIPNEMPTPRVALSTSVVNGKIYAIGGASKFAPDLEFLGMVEAYDPATYHWDTQLTEMPTPRYFPASAVVDGKIYTFGGDMEGFTRSSIVECYTAPDSVMTSVEEEFANVPASFVLHQNYPNPFNPGTTITFELQQAGFVTLSVYNATGQLIERLLHEKKTAGFHGVLWDASNCGSGLYFYRIRVGKHAAVRKALLLK